MVAETEAKEKKPEGAWSNKPWNDPKKVDSLLGWGIIIAFGGLTFIALSMNIEPYTAWFRWMLRLTPLRWLPGIPTLLALVFGVLFFAGIQLGEIKPLLMLDSKLEKRDFEWRKKLFGWCCIAAGCYAIDATCCSIFWPPLSVPFEQFRYAPTWGGVAWLNIAITFFTLFGLSAYVLLYRFVRKVM